MTWISHLVFWIVPGIHLSTICYESAMNPVHYWPTVIPKRRSQQSWRVREFRYCNRVEVPSQVSSNFSSASWRSYLCYITPRNLGGPKIAMSTSTKVEFWRGCQKDLSYPRQSLETRLSLDPYYSRLVFSIQSIVISKAEASLPISRDNYSPPRVAGTIIRDTWLQESASVVTQSNSLDHIPFQ